jgi:hypothetical protein
VSSIGTAEHCAALLSEYSKAGVDEVLLWPVDDLEDQLARFTQEVIPLVGDVLA